MKTKKVGSTGRFGSRYGMSIRRRVLKVEREQRAKHKCPDCSKNTLKRMSAGIFYCKNCGMNMAGKAYVPK